MAKLTTALLQRSASLAAQMLKVQGELTEAFNERYGATYSDVDCDELIDVLDYGGGHVTLKIADEAMERCGHPPIKKQDHYRKNLREDFERAKDAGLISSEEYKSMGADKWLETPQGRRAVSAASKLASK